MRTNNYTKAENGPSIELTCFYDDDSCRRMFAENFQILQSESYSKNTVAYYIENGNVKDADDITFKLTGKPADIVAAYVKEGNEIDDDAINQPERLAEYCEELLETYGERITLLNFEEASNVFAPLTVETSKEIESIVTRGYCQGDYAKVYFCRDDLHTAWGRIPTDGDLQTIFDHLFWDAPIYAQFEIDGTEYTYWDCPEYDDYKWKREEFAAWVAKESGADYEALLAMLPENPEYI